MKQTQTYDTTENGNKIDSAWRASLVQLTERDKKQSGKTFLKGTGSRSKHHHSSSHANETWELDLFDAQSLSVPLTGFSWMIVAVANAILLQW